MIVIDELDFEARYKIQEFTNSKDLLAIYSKLMESRNYHQVIIRTPNTEQYGESDKELQSIITHLNERNFQIFKKLLEYSNQGSRNMDSNNTSMS